MDGATAQPVFEILTDHDHVLLSVLPSGERQPITDKAPPVECARVSGWGGGGAETENAGIENGGAYSKG